MTEWSQGGRHTGKTDLPLLAEGETDARALRGTLGSLLPPVAPALVITSPLQRAVRTCELAGFGDVAVVDPRLSEWDYGEFEGLTTQEIRQTRPTWDLFRDGCPTGELPSQVGARVDSLLRDLRHDRALARAEVLCFSHGHVSRVLLARWLGLPPAEARHFQLGAGSFGRLGWEHEWPTVETWNH